MKRNAPYYLLVLVLLALDQTAKAVIVRSLGHYGSIQVIPGFFSLSRVHNKGAIFGMFNRMDGPLITVLLTVASLVALVMVVVYFFKTPSSEKWMKISLAFILGGALGNLTDRIVRGYVVDFLEFSVGRYRWPTFNVADSCISLGAVLLIVVFLVRRPSHVSHPD